MGVSFIGISSVSYPPVETRPYFIDNYKLLTDNYIEQVRDDYYNKGGIPQLSVREIVVTANKMFSKMKSVGGEIYAQNDFKKDNTHSLFDAIKELPGIHWRPRSITPDPIPMIFPNNAMFWEKTNLVGEPIYDVFLYQGKDIYAYILDDFIVSIEFLRNVDISCVESIELIPDARLASFNSLQQITFEHRPDCNPGLTRIIYIRTNERFRQLLATSPGLTIFRKLGYSDAKEFYNPVYDIPQKRKTEEPDLRTTIYWNPAITPDKYGNTNIHYYTTDYPNKNRIIIEGVTAQGNPLYYSSALIE